MSFDGTLSTIVCPCTLVVVFNDNTLLGRDIRIVPIRRACRVQTGRLHSSRGLIPLFIDPQQIIVYEDRAVADRSFLGIRQRAYADRTGNEI